MANRSSGQKKDPKSNQPKKSKNTAATQKPQPDKSEFDYPAYNQQESKLAPGLMKPIPEEIVVEWKASSRPFKKKDKKFFSTVFIICLLVCLILFFAGQVLPVAVVVAVAFLVYVLSVIPPEKITYKISNYGIRVGDNLYYWEEMGRFWLDKKYDFQLLMIETIRFPGRLTIVLDKKMPIDALKDILSEVLLNKKPEPTLYEKVANWLQEKIPLES
ncbi:MAG: hypothetical protein U9O78_01820 [Patescibacteria group bacterium]|nr:hypothetical protein [Patescibacteria group bacterium]